MPVACLFKVVVWMLIVGFSALRFVAGWRRAGCFDC